MNCPKCGVKFSHLIGGLNGEYRCAECNTVVADSEENARILLSGKTMAYADCSGNSELIDACRKAKEADMALIITTGISILEKVEEYLPEKK